MRPHRLLGLLPLTLSALHGCAVDPDDPAAATAQPLFSGQPTLARAEVGVMNGTRGRCGATMISDRHFVTSSTCIGYAPLLRGQNAVYIRLDLPTGPLGLSVDRVFSQSRGTGADDVAVGRINGWVPEGRITPAGIATSQPSNEWLSVVSYNGCDSLHTASDERCGVEYYHGGGRSTNQPLTGSPVFRGPLSGRGDIVRVHSEFFLNIHPGDTWWDVGADAVRYRAHILALASAMETTGVCYRAHVESRGWMPAVCNDTVAGTVGESMRMEGFQLWSGRTDLRLCYQGYVESVGWQPEVCDGDLAGTVGQSRRLEAVRVRAVGAPLGTTVSYRAHVQGIGWQPEVSNGQIAGTTGQSRRLEALRVRLTVPTRPPLRVSP